MKKFKKIMAVVMVMVLLMCSLPMTSVGAAAVQLKLNTAVEVKTGSLLHPKFKPAKDGWYKFYSTGDDFDTYATLYDTYYNEIAYGDDSFTDIDDANFVLSAKLKGGKTYYLEVDVYDTERSVAVSVTVEETVGVESAEITKMPDNTTVIEGFEDETYSLYGLEMRFALSDGSTVDWSFDDGSDVVADTYINSYSVGYDNGDFAVVIECGEAYVEIPYTVGENPVESIEYKSDTPIEIYEKSNGYLDEGSGQYYYFYEIPEDAVLVFNYKDGRKEEVDIAYDEDIAFNWYDGQYEEPWGVGTHYITVSYYDVSTQIPVTILPSPFKSVVVNTQPSVDYYFGDFEFGYLEDGEYTFYPLDLSGMSFTVEYEDGTTQTFDDNDFDADNFMIDGYEYNVSAPVIYEAGQVDAVLYYKGAEIPFTVNVVETYIKSIEVVKPPVKAEYEYDYYADYTGAVIKINYKDGTSAQAEANADTMYYECVGDVVCNIKVGDDVVRIYNMVDFETDELYDYITCAGAQVRYDGVNYTDSRYVKSIEAENVTMSGEGMVITVHYEDGTTEKLTFDVLDYFVKEDHSTEACAMTENGVLTFSIEKWHYENSNDYTTTVFVLGESVDVELVEPAPGLKGDADGDGKVSILDASLIQLHRAQMATIDEANLKLADTDNDGQVTILDATRIQLFLAQMLPEL